MAFGEVVPLELIAAGPAIGLRLRLAAHRWAPYNDRAAVVDYERGGRYIRWREKRLREVTSFILDGQNNPDPGFNWAANRQFPAEDELVISAAQVAPYQTQSNIFEPDVYRNYQIPEDLIAGATAIGQRADADLMQRAANLTYSHYPTIDAGGDYPTLTTLDALDYTADVLPLELAMRRAKFPELGVRKGYVGGELGDALKGMDEFIRVSHIADNLAPSLLVSNSLNGLRAGGISWFSAPTSQIHTAGTYDNGAVTVSADVAVGENLISFAGGVATTGTLNVGDLFTVDQTGQQFVVASADKKRDGLQAGTDWTAGVGGALNNVRVRPRVKYPITSGAAVTFLGDHRYGLLHTEAAFKVLLTGLTQASEWNYFPMMSWSDEGDGDFPGSGIGGAIVLSGDPATMNTHRDMLSIYALQLVQGNAAMRWAVAI